MSDGFDALCTALKSAGVGHVFGVPGTQNVSLFDAFRRHSIRTVLASHELAASFMANGYYRATGRVAALVTIPGPGFTYALTGLAEAKLDSVGLLYLVGIPATKPGRMFQLQAIDQHTIAGPLVKERFELMTAANVGQVIRDAHTAANSGEPGPVMVHIDIDGMSGATPAAITPVEKKRTERPAEIADARTRLTKLFTQARRPVLLLGQGAFGSAQRLERIATTNGIPIFTTPTARGIVAEDNPLVMGFDSLRGHVGVVNQFLDRADLIVALGCKLGHNGSAGFELRLGADRLVHVDASPSVPGANYDAQLPVVARVEDIVDCLEARRAASEWPLEEIATARASMRSPTGEEREPVITGPQSLGQSLAPSEFFSWLRNLLPREAIVVTDSGQHQILTRRHFEVHAARGLICPSDFQSMGFGLPAAIGARLGETKRPIVAIIGDGGFLMSGLELLTARREEASLVVFVFNDGYLNQIRMQQWREFGHAHAVELLNPDFEGMAAALGIDYLRFDQLQDAQLQQALGANRVTLIEVLVGDSTRQRMMPVIARAKGAARTVVRSGLRGWLTAKFRR